MFDKVAEIGLSGVADALRTMSSMSSDSLVEYTKVTRVEPICLIDTNCMNFEGIEDLTQSLLTCFAGYYLQAVAVSTVIGDINVIGKLGPLNPNRDPISETNLSYLDSLSGMLATESYKYSLPKPGAKPMSLGLEAAYVKDDEKKPEVVDEVADVKFGMSKDVHKQMTEMANLSVGKILHVELVHGKDSITIPVNVRLLVNSVPSTSLIHILSSGQVDMTWKQRWHAWRAGRLEGIKDMIFCQDLIEAHRKKLMDDKTGVYGQVISRKRKNALATITSGNPSVATASNIVVLADTTVAELELATNLQLGNFKQREQLLEETSIMILAVVDQRRDMTTFYHRSIPESNTVSTRGLKASNKNGPDVSDVLRAYQIGHSPSL